MLRHLRLIFGSCSHLGAILRPSWGHLGPSWGHLGAILGHLGAILGPLGAILVPLEAILEPLGAILGPSWGHLGPSGGHLGASWGHKLLKHLQSHYSRRHARRLYDAHPPHQELHQNEKLRVQYLSPWSNASSSKVFASNSKISPSNSKIGRPEPRIQLFFIELEGFCAPMASKP